MKPVHVNLNRGGDLSHLFLAFDLIEVSECTHLHPDILSALLFCLFVCKESDLSGVHQSGRREREREGAVQHPAWRYSSASTRTTPPSSCKPKAPQKIYEVLRAAATFPLVDAAEGEERKSHLAHLVACTVTQPTSKAGTNLTKENSDFWNFLKLEFEVRTISFYPFYPGV